MCNRKIRGDVSLWCMRFCKQMIKNDERDRKSEITRKN